jgi:hypothetical protein
MNTQRIDLANTQAGKVIATFLKETASPTVQDWKRLISKHPEYAADIADAAMLHQDARPLVEGDLKGKVNEEVYQAGVSKVLSLLHSAPSPQLEDAQKKVVASRGPAVRQLAPEVGLGSAPALLSSILVGNVVAPKQVLRRLAEELETSVMALAEVFARAFAGREVPAYKTQGGKPQMPSVPTPWKEAVQASGLTEKQMQDLLNLDE